MIEIERLFLIDNLEDLRKKIIDLGFRLRNKEVQYAEYLDYPDFQLFQKKQDFRFRNIYDEKQEYSRCEISFSHRKFSEKKNEERDQISLTIGSIQILDKFKAMLHKMGMINSFKIWKYREEYSQSNKEDFRNELHIEIDFDIKMSKFPHQQEYHLESTLQLCKEIENEKEVPEIDNLMNQLNLKREDIITQNYQERLNKAISI